jgi:hypothetical protein
LPEVHPGPHPKNGFVTVYDHGKTREWVTFDEVKKHASKTWANSPKKFDPISAELKDKIKLTISAQMNRNAKSGL